MTTKFQWVYKISTNKAKIAKSSVKLRFYDQFCQIEP